ncbi:MAG: DegT/DnrJ/EryC1/StrS family aminotransferase, partial [Gammaproteobacteria bacterium]|nr:DegT/DnrJ/EryC1/StrS family aminotransferase [Gammaproteobacteria bacterium]
MSVMSVPLNDLQRYLRGRGTDLLGQAELVVRSGHCILGPQVAAFERSFAEYCNVRHCIGVANGTDAIEIALRCVGVQQGQHVVVAANAGMYATTA